MTDIPLKFCVRTLTRYDNSHAPFSDGNVTATLELEAPDAAWPASTIAKRVLLAATAPFVANDTDSAEPLALSTVLDKFVARLGDAAPTEDAPPVENIPEWIVNDLGELGVKVGGRLFFLYKGSSLEYTSPEHTNSDGPSRYRPVGKREFGEVCRSTPHNVEIAIRKIELFSQNAQDRTTHSQLKDVLSLLQEHRDDAGDGWVPMPRAAATPTTETP